MSIDKDIQQTKPFISEFHKAVVNIQYTQSWVVEIIKELLKQYDLSPQQYNILRILKGSKYPISTIEIKEKMLDKMSDASRIVDRLIAKGLVNKTISAEDRRRVDISITKNGIDLINQMQEFDNKIEIMFSNLSVSEAKQLNMLLDKFRGSK